MRRGGEGLDIHLRGQGAEDVASRENGGLGGDIDGRAQYRIASLVGQRRCRRLTWTTYGH